MLLNWDATCLHQQKTGFSDPQSHSSPGPCVLQYLGLHKAFWLNLEEHSIRVRKLQSEIFWHFLFLLRSVFLLHSVIWKTIGFGNYFARSVPICFSCYMSLDDKLELLELRRRSSKAEFLAEFQLAELIQNLKLSNIPSRSPLDTYLNLSSVLNLTGKSLGNSAIQSAKTLLLATGFLNRLGFLSIRE